MYSGTSTQALSRDRQDFAPKQKPRQILVESLYVPSPLGVPARLGTNPLQNHHGYYHVLASVDTLEQQFHRALECRTPLTLEPECFARQSSFPLILRRDWLGPVPIFVKSAAEEASAFFQTLFFPRVGICNGCNRALRPT